MPGNSMDFCVCILIFIQQINGCILKDAAADLVCIQTVGYLLWDALLSVWTWLCISQAGLLKDWYLALQCALDYFDLWELSTAIFWP